MNDRQRQARKKLEEFLLNEPAIFTIRPVEQDWAAVQRHPEEFVRYLCETGRPVSVLVQGEPSLVVQHIKAYRKLQSWFEEFEKLRDLIRAVDEERPV